MAKRKKAPRRYRSPGSRAGGGGGDMMAQLRQMEEAMARTQAELAEKTVEVSVGGGVVRVIATGQQKIQRIEINPDVVDPDDVEMLQDLVLAAVNEALDQAQAMANEAMSGLTGGLNLPPGLL